MRWSSVIELIAIAQTQDDYGEVVETETQREVFANKKSVRQSEFYQAFAVGMKPEIVFEVRAIEYQDESRASFEGVKYFIIRTFTKNDEVLELVCSKYPMR